jgi:predicted Zn-dependent protease
VSYLSANQLEDAERLCKYFLRDNKTHPEGMRLLAEVLTKKNVLDEAQYILETLHELQPDHTQATAQLFHVLLRRQRSHAAFDIAVKLREQHPNDKHQIKIIYAAACFAIGRTEEAKQLYAELQQ